MASRPPLSDVALERLRRGYAALERGDLEAVLEFVDPDVELHDRPESPDAGTYRGHEGVVTALELTDDTFEQLEFHPEEFHQGGDKVVVVIRMRGIGKGSGAPVEERIAHLWTVRDDRAVHLQVYSDPDEALRVAGLR